MGLSVWLIERPRWFKRALLIIADLILLSFSIWLAYSLRLSTLYVPDSPGNWLLMAAAPIVGVITFYFRGLYKLVTRFLGPDGARRIYVAVFIATVAWALVVLMSGIRSYPRSVIVIYGLIAAGLIRLSRQWAGSVLLKGVLQNRPDAGERRPVIIYGAGRSGVQLLEALHGSGHYQPVAFLDNDPSLAGQIVHGLQVHSPQKVGRLIEQHDVAEVMLAMPSALRSERRAAIAMLEPYAVQVRTLPALEEIASGKVQVSDLRPIEVDDLLGRDPVEINLEQMAAHIRGKAVMVTGAGGSIGSELSRQLLRLGPRLLVLLELSEAALYEIECELKDFQHREGQRRGGRSAGVSETKIVSVLGSILDRALLDSTLKEHGIDVIYHAAAYKHVPIVEENPLAGIQNNTFGTLSLAEAAREAGVERFVLVSSDKAVRPTNVMGASKRLAEMLLQGLAAEPDIRTVFTMVRFGNVLDSSGSVVRRFRKQIEDGGPVTVTHPEIIRYFMSIPEAAQLVIQAGAMARGGEVFLLDMGTPVRIADLARTMIRLSGLEVRDEENPGGDIAIEYIGLRRGEKLYEELLIGADAEKTSHSRIFRTVEPLLSYCELLAALERLAEAVESRDEAKMQAILTETVEGYSASGIAQLATDDQWRPISSTLH